MEKCPPDWNPLKLGLINMKTKFTGIPTHWAQKSHNHPVDAGLFFKYFF